MNKVKALSNLIIVKKILEGLNITFWLDGGTCLGAYRSNDFLDTDFDIDIGVLGEDDGKIKDIKQALKDEGFSFFHIKEHPCGEGKQISCVKDVPLDIFFYYKRGDKRWRCMFDHHPSLAVRFIPCVLPEYVFNERQRIDFMDYETFDLPHKDYLTLQYGDWQTDKTKNEFHWQTDYKCMDMSFPIYKKPKGKRRWLMTDTIEGKEANGDFFIPLLKEGYKLFPIEVTEDREVIDGHKRLSAYRQLNIPMVECYVKTSL